MDDGTERERERKRVLRRKGFVAKIYWVWCWVWALGLDSTSWVGSTTSWVGSTVTVFARLWPQDEVPRQKGINGMLVRLGLLKSN